MLEAYLVGRAWKSGWPPPSSGGARVHHTGRQHQVPSPAGVQQAVRERDDAARLGKVEGDDVGVYEEHVAAGTAAGLWEPADGSVAAGRA